MTEQAKREGAPTVAELSWSPVQLLSLDEEARTVEYVMSDDSVDSYGEIVRQNWRLDRFTKNPVVLYSHNRQTGTGLFGGTGLSQEESLPIGRVVKGPARKGNKGEGYRLIGTVEFATEDINPFAEKVWRMVKAGYLKGGSVGFYPHDVRVEKQDDVDRYVLDDNELFEFSIAPLPANANAVANAVGDTVERRAYLARRCADNPSQPAASGQENPMSDHDLETKLADLGAAVEKATADAQAATELALTAETRAAEVEARLTTATAEVERLAATLTERDAELVTLKASVEAITGERDQARTLAAEFESAVIELELGALVGRKFHAAELPFMREDRKAHGRDGFAARMAARPDLKTLEPKVPADLTPPDTYTTDEPGAKTSAHLKEKAG